MPEIGPQKFKISGNNERIVGLAGVLEDTPQVELNLKPNTFLEIEIDGEYIIFRYDGYQAYVILPPNVKEAFGKKTPSPNMALTAAGRIHAVPVTYEVADCISQMLEAPTK